MLSTKMLSMVVGISTSTLVAYSKRTELKPYVEHVGKNIKFKESVIEFLKTYKPERKKRKEESGREYTEKDTICWHCKTNPNECMWLRFHIPVEGWVAKVVNNCNPGGKQSYRVQICPNYKKGK